MVFKPTFHYQESCYGNRNNPEAIAAWKGWLRQNKLEYYICADSKTDIARILKRGNLHSVLPVDTKLGLVIDHARIYKQKGSAACILLAHYYDYAELLLPRLMEYCKENGLLFRTLPESWYFPGVAHAYVLYIPENEKYFAFPESKKRVSK